MPPAERACSPSTQPIGAKPGNRTRPFNIAGDTLRTHLLADRCGLEVGDFVCTGGDCHRYRDHHDQARLQSTRVPGALPRLAITRIAPAIGAYRPEDLTFHDHIAQPAIRAPVAVAV